MYFSMQHYIIKEKINRKRKCHPPQINSDYELKDLVFWQIENAANANTPKPQMNYKPHMKHRVTPHPAMLDIYQAHYFITITFSRSLNGSLSSLSVSRPSPLFHQEVGCDISLVLCPSRLSYTHSLSHTHTLSLSLSFLFVPPLPILHSSEN